MEDLQKKPVRINVLILACAVLAVGLVALGYAWTGGTETAAAMAIAGASGGALATMAKDIIIADSNPFDAEAATHALRIRQLDSEADVKLKQLELDHEHRNGQNKAMQTLIEAAVGGGGGSTS